MSFLRSNLRGRRKVQATVLLALVVVAALVIWRVGFQPDGDLGSPGATSPPADGARVTIYTSIDEPVARQIVRRFEQQTGIRVVLVTDTEATKSVGLAERLRAEQRNPQADVWWGNEPFHTIRLADEGLLAPYESPSASDIPERFKDKKHRWASSGLRARVIARSARGLDEQTMAQPASLLDLLDERVKGRIVMARPTAGTTGGHVAALYLLWGPDEARNYLRGLRANGIKLVGGNSVVAEQVGRGVFALGLTDNDDIAAARNQGGRLDGALPDQRSFGTLVVPTTVALVTGARNLEPARQLIDYLLSHDVERAMIEAEFTGWSVRDDIQTLRAMEVDYREVARLLPEAVREATAILEGRE